jgi:hypothetical protein
LSTWLNGIQTMVLHGNLGNPYTLWTTAQVVFEEGQQ